MSTSLRERGPAPAYARLPAFAFGSQYWRARNQPRPDGAAAPAEASAEPELPIDWLQVRAFQDWLGVTRPAARLLAVLSEDSERLWSARELIARLGPPLTDRSLRRHLSALRAAMDEGAIARDAVGVRLTRIGVSECEHAVREFRAATERN